MGFFDFLKKSAEPAAPAAPAFPLVLAADAKGAVVPMEQIPDEVFASWASAAALTPPRARFTPPSTARSPRPRTVATHWASRASAMSRC